MGFLLSLDFFIKHCISSEPKGKILKTENNYCKTEKNFYKVDILMMEMSMADVAPTVLYEQKTKAPSASLERIKRLSRPFEIGFAGLALLSAAFFIFLVVMAFVPGGPFVFIGQGGGYFVTDPAKVPAGYIPVRELVPVAIGVGLIAAVFITGSKIVSFILLSRLFGCYQLGNVFGDRSITLMRQSGFALVVAAFAPAIAQPFVRVAGALDENWFHGSSVAALMVGSALFLFAHIITLGLELERENKGFV